MFDVIGGVHWAFPPRWGMNSELRYRFHSDEDSIPRADDFEDWIVNIGFTYNFGDRARPAPPKAEPVWYNCTVKVESHCSSKELDDLEHGLGGYERLPNR